MKDVNNLCYDSPEALDVKIRIDGPYRDMDTEDYLTDIRTIIVNEKTPA